MLWGLKRLFWTLQFGRLNLPMSKVLGQNNRKTANILYGHTHLNVTGIKAKVTFDFLIGWSPTFVGTWER